VSSRITGGSFFPRLAEGRAFPTLGRDQVVPVRRRQRGLCPEYSYLPLVLEPGAAHRFATGHRRFRGEHRILTWRHQAFRNASFPKLIVERGEEAVTATITISAGAA